MLCVCRRTPRELSAARHANARRRRRLWRAAASARRCGSPGTTHSFAPPEKWDSGRGEAWRRTRGRLAQPRSASHGLETRDQYITSSASIRRRGRTGPRSSHANRRPGERDRRGRIRAPVRRARVARVASATPQGAQPSVAQRCRLVDASTPRLAGTRRPVGDGLENLGVRRCYSSSRLYGSPGQRRQAGHPAACVPQLRGCLRPRVLMQPDYAAQLQECPEEVRGHGGTGVSGPRLPLPLRRMPSVATVVVGAAVAAARRATARRRRGEVACSRRRRRPRRREPPSRRGASARLLHDMEARPRRALRMREVRATSAGWHETWRPAPSGCTVGRQVDHGEQPRPGGRRWTQRPTWNALLLSRRGAEETAADPVWTRRDKDSCQSVKSRAQRAPGASARLLAEKPGRVHRASARELTEFDNWVCDARHLPPSLLRIVAEG